MNIFTRTLKGVSIEVKSTSDGYRAAKIEGQIPTRMLPELMAMLNESVKVVERKKFVPVKLPDASRYYAAVPQT